MQTIDSLLSQLGLGEAETKTYLALLKGASNARDIIKTTRQKRPTVYYALSMLERRGLISRVGGQYDKPIETAPLNRLQNMIDTKKMELQKLSGDIDEFAKAFSQKSKKANKPLVQFYEGVEAVQNVIMESVYTKTGLIRTITPNNNFFWQTGDSFAESYVAERVRRNIKTKNLWEAPISKNIYLKSYKDLSEIRILPSVMHGKFDSTIFLYDDKTMYISSLKNAYCVLIISEEHHDTMRACFEGLWASSSKYPNNDI